MMVCRGRCAALVLAAWLVLALPGVALALDWVYMPGQPENKVFTLVFNRAVDPGTLAGVFISRDGAGEDRLPTRAWLMGPYRVKVTAWGALERGGEYFLFTGEDVRSVDGEALPGVRLRFTVLEEGEASTTLRWGREPYDLDAVFVPLEDGAGEFYRNADVVTGYGPEVVVFREMVDGDFYVLRPRGYYRGSRGLGDSGATVTVRDVSGVTGHYRVPPGLEGDTWHVFSVRGGEVLPPVR